MTGAWTETAESLSTSNRPRVTSHIRHVSQPTSHQSTQPPPQSQPTRQPTPSPLPGHVSTSSHNPLPGHVSVHASSRLSPHVQSQPTSYSSTFQPTPHSTLRPMIHNRRLIPRPSPSLNACPSTRLPRLGTRHSPRPTARAAHSARSFSVSQLTSHTPHPSSHCTFRPTPHHSTPQLSSHSP